MDKTCEICGSHKSVYFNKQISKYLCNAHSKQISRYGFIKSKTTRQPKNQFVFYDDFVEMELYHTNGEFVSYTLLDMDDYDKVKDFKWHISSGYVINVQLGRIHNYLLDTPDGFVVDHISMNKLDNRKENLRICTQQENCFNKTEYTSNSSGHRGVVFNKKTGKWRARIGINGKQMHLGYYDKIQDAIDTRIKAELKYYGEFSPVKYKED